MPVNVRALIAALSISVTAVALAADCTQTSTGRVPLSDLGTGLYLGQFQGGLYPDGLNYPPPAHRALARSAAVSIQPRRPDGSFGGDGRIVMLSIGMSNTTQEFCSGGGPPCSPASFVGKASADSSVDHTWLTLVDGAAGGQTAATWDSPADSNYNRVRDMELAPLGLTEAQVQVVWIKLANPSPTVSLPSPSADAYTLSGQLAAVARSVAVRYPNCKLAFISSRIYAGYASSALNPEPYAYESGFSVKWVIGEQIAQQQGAAPSALHGPLLAGANAPILLWGPYLWADGLTPRGDGLIWNCADLQADGTHPSSLGVAKASDLLMQFFLDSAYSQPWFLALKSADLNADGVVDGADLGSLLAVWGLCPQGCAADVNWDGRVDGADLGILIGQWGSVGG